MFSRVQLFKLLISSCIVHNAYAAFGLGGSSGKTPYLNDIFDAVAIKKGVSLAQPKIPVQGFNQLMGGIDVSASGGEYSGANSFKRSTNAVKTQGSGSQKYIVSATMKLSKSTLTFKTVTVKSGADSGSGALAVTISGTLVDVSIGLDYSSTQCSTTVEAVKITNVGTVKPSASGQGKFNSIYKKAGSATPVYNDKINTLLKTIITQAISTNLREFKCDYYKDQITGNVAKKG